MCGIVAYVGPRRAADYLLEGLRRLEYRGYDSAGIATTDDEGHFHLVKAVGRIDNLAERLSGAPAPGRIGIGHTRWATHGAPCEANAHPHVGGRGEVLLAHNGVIENYLSLKEKLRAEGYRFTSSTDTEAVAHLVASCLARCELRTDQFDPNDPYARPLAAVAEATSKLRGTYGLVILFRDYPELIVAARQGSPLVVGVGHGEHFIASDASPLAGRADKIVYLADHQIAAVTADTLQVTHREQGRVEHAVHDLQIESNDVELGQFPHYMLKEIYEQPESLQNAMRGRLNDEDATAVFGGLNLSPQDLRQINRIVLTACGTSWHAALVGEYLIEELARIPVEVEYASELRYRNPPVEQGTLLFAITQSGETADTLAALREMKRKGHPTLAICNVVGSTIAQEANGGVYLHAGPEVGVASTKAYTSQVVTLAMLALYFGRSRHLSFEAGKRIISQLRQLPEIVRRTLNVNEEVARVAAKYAEANNFLYLGRQYNFPTALEGALKLKEISYIHAEGYAAGEMKHGPIALIDDSVPVIVIAPSGPLFEKTVSNMQEVAARGGRIVLISDAAGIAKAGDGAIATIEMPDCHPLIQPLVYAVPVQLLAYHVAVAKGTDVDQPRNLAKSVTVE